MRKYVLYTNNQLSVENIIGVADTEHEIREQYKTAKIFRRIVGKEEPQMALVEMAEEDLEKVLK